jgi:hypothetical protein
LYEYGSLERLLRGVKKSERRHDKLLANIGMEEKE